MAPSSPSPTVNMPATPPVRNATFRAAGNDPERAAALQPVPALRMAYEQARVRHGHRVEIYDPDVASGDQGYIRLQDAHGNRVELANAR